MSDKTVLVIDDSATIRKLVDTHLSSDGYQVVLAPNAEVGIELAGEVQPDLILLDHQLPGTTGYNVCCQLIENESLRGIPVVVSSTLRKKAYAEYIDLDNVVDMLPKPYTEELLLTTVANAIQTATMIVDSQSQGTAVPEVIQQLESAVLSGSLAAFGIRELIDFLNNGRKTGVLEIEAERMRIRIHLAKGRIQAVYGSGIDQETIESITSKLPDSLTTLAPILKMTISGRSCAEVDGFVQLLDQKVLDPRLMTKLLRFQAAMLLRMAFKSSLKEFCFEGRPAENALQKSLPLDISLLALLVEAALYDHPTDQNDASQVAFVRTAVRGQNLDRAGLSARHLKLLGILDDPRTPDEIAQSLNWEMDEVVQVLDGFQSADLIEQRKQVIAGQYIVFEPDAMAAKQLRASLEATDARYSGKVVRDKLALQLVLKRNVPHTILFAADHQASADLIRQLFSTSNPKAANVRRIAICDSQAAEAMNWDERIGFTPDRILDRPCTAESLFAALDALYLDGAPQPSSDSQGAGSQFAPLNADPSCDNAPVGAELC